MKEENKSLKNVATATEYREGNWHVIEVSDSMGNITIIKTTPKDTIVSRNDKTLLNTIELAEKLAIFNKRREEFNKSRQKLDAFLTKFKL